jgi:multidrug efflux system membrane fusion protein
MRKSFIIAAVCTLLLVLWMLSGLMFNQPDNATALEQRGSASPQMPLFKVAVQSIAAEQTPLFITANGQVEPFRVVQVRAQTEGQIDQVFATEGEHIEQGHALAKIAIDDRLIRLAEQQALLESRTNTLSRLEQLAQRNYQSQSDLDRSRADVKGAQAAIANIELEIAHTNVSAPFSGMLERLLVEQGDFIQVNGPVAILLDQDPLLVTVPIAQQDVNKLSLGSAARIELSTGESVIGTLSFISPRASAQTRTFEAEIKIDNADGRLRSGMSAKAQIATERVPAHFISPALFSLGSDGEIGVKVVDAANIVRFYPVTILQSGTRGAWVGGLPQQARVIVSGQGFVAAGNEVRVEEVSDVLDSSQNDLQSDLQNKQASSLQTNAQSDSPSSTANSAQSNTSSVKARAN